MKDEEPQTFMIVRNREMQFSIWWSDKPIPPGWKRMEFQGTRESCLTQIDKLWLDVRPLSLQQELINRTRSVTKKLTTNDDIEPS